MLKGLCDKKPKNMNSLYREELQSAEYVKYMDKISKLVPDGNQIRE